MTTGRANDANHDGVVGTLVEQLAGVTGLRARRPKEDVERGRNFKGTLIVSGGRLENLSCLGPSLQDMAFAMVESGVAGSDERKL